MSQQSVVRRSGLGALVALLAMSFLVLVPRAGATTVVNGDFETGSLSGWTVYNNNESEAGNWFAYSGTTSPIGLGPALPPPPQGTFAAITAQGGPGTHVLYQDVALEPGYPHVLSLTAYYVSDAPLANPDTLS